MIKNSQAVTTDTPFLKADQEQTYQEGKKDIGSIPQAILVTGSPRSGTTWMGKMIASSPAVGYIHEPFNLAMSPGICAATFPYWFTYVTEEIEAQYYEALKNTLAFRFNLRAERPTLRSVRDVGRMTRNYTKFAWHHLAHTIPLMKDPVAFFSAEWLARRFTMQVVVTVRHPAAFVQSMKRLQWTQDFSHFLQQPLLMRDHLYPFEAEITEYAKTEHDIIDQSILLWRLCNHMVMKYALSHKDWIFVRHEDIAANPIAGFEQIFRQLNLDFSPHVKKTIIDYTNEANPREAKKGFVLRKRNSKQIPAIWREKLTSEEIMRVRKGTEDISHHFYAENEW